MQIITVSRRLVAVVLALATILAGLAGCASSGPKIITNSAPNFVLANYRTFGFMQPLSTDRDGVRSLDSQQLIVTTSQELERLGLARDDTDPDLLVNFLLASKERLETRPTTSGSVYVGRGGYSRWGGYGVGMGTTTEVVQRTEGTLSIDIIDAELNQLVWEGSARGRVTDAMRENRREVLDAGVREILARLR